MAPLDVRYAPAADGSKIGYTVTGGGPLAVVLTPSLLAQAEPMFEEPTIVRFLVRLTARSQLLVMDRRGTGFSDRPTTRDDLSMDRLCEDIEAVLDDAGIERAVIMAHSWGGPGGIHFAATRPERTAGLVLTATRVKNSRGDGYELGPTPQEVDDLAATVEGRWGTEGDRVQFARSHLLDRRFHEWMASQERRSYPPGAVPDLFRAIAVHDARSDPRQGRCTDVGRPPA